MTESYLIGEKEKSVLAYHPEEHLNLPIKDVRKALWLPEDGI